MRIVFLGTPEFGRIVLERVVRAGWEVPLVITQPDRTAQRRGRGDVEPSTVGAFATKQNIPVLKPAAIREIEAAITKAAADVCVVAAYGQIIPESTLDLPDTRWVNVHGSLLPAYRGAAPIQQAILDGTSVTGASLMEVVSELDAGPVIGQVKVTITEADDSKTLSDKVAAAGADLLVDQLPDYVAGKRAPTPQDTAAVTMTRTLIKGDGRIDWSKDAPYLARFVRAMRPWPSAWTELDGTPLVITAAAHSEGTSPGPPGAFDATSPLRVTTGDGTLQVERVRPAGKREMSGEAWLHGRRRGGRFT